MFMQLKRALFLLVASLLSSSLALAGEPAALARLSKVDPSDALAKGWVRVIQGGAARPATLGMTIKAGDEVVLLDTQAAVRLTLPDGGEKWVHYGESPYVFATRAPGVTEGLLKVAAVFGLLKNFGSSGGDRVKASASTSRGAEGRCGCTDAQCLPVIPADNIAPPVRLVAGSRSLTFHWVGGTSPYRFQVSRNGVVIEAVDQIDACQVTLSNRDWSPGVYSLELRDPHSKSGYRDDSLIFVDAANLPKPPAELSKNDLSQADNLLLEVDWLARQGSGEWRLEAIQRVQPLLGKHPLAELWLQIWAEGKNIDF